MVIVMLKKIIKDGEVKPELINGIITFIENANNTR